MFGALKGVLFGSFYRTFVAVLLIVWPYAILQSCLRVVLIVLTIDKFFFSYLISIPFILLAGVIYDIIVCLHIVLTIILFCAILPFRFRAVYFGKIIIFGFAFVLSCCIMFTFWAELVAWVSRGVRIESSSFIFNCISILDDTLKSNGVLHNVVFKVLLFVLLVLIPSFAITRVVCDANLTPDGAFVVPFSKEYIASILLISGLLLCSDIYHSCFDMFRAIFGESSYISSNRYVYDCSRNGIYDSIVSTFSRFWNGHDYVSVSPSYRNMPFARSVLSKKDSRWIVNRIASNIITSNNIAFIDSESDIYSSIPIRVANPVLSHHATRKNLIIVLLDSSYFGTGHGFDLMPYTTSLASNSVFFNNAYAPSSDSFTSVGTMMLSTLPNHVSLALSTGGGPKRIFSLANVLLSQGYSVKSFTDRSKDGLPSYKILKDVGFNIQTISTIPLSTKKKRKKNRGNIDSAIVEIDETFSRKSNVNLDAITSALINVADNESNYFAYVIPSGLLYNCKNNFLSSIGSVFQKRSKIEKKNLRGIDIAIQTLIEKSKNSSWFNDTVFVFIADKAHKHVSKLPLDINASVVPFGIFVPNSNGLLVDQKVDYVDFAPTVLSVMGIGYVSKFSGVDASRGKSQNSAFIGRSGSLGYLKDDLFMLIETHRRFSAYEAQKTNDRYSSGVTIHGVGSDTVSKFRHLNGSDYKVSKSLSKNYLSSVLHNGSFLLSVSHCEKCMYTNVSFDKSSLSWRVGMQYSKPVNGMIMTRYYSLLSENRVDVAMLELISANQLLYNVAASYRNVEYNIVS